jgi:hypothetical protein
MIGRARAATREFWLPAATTTRVGPEALGTVASAMKGVIVTRYDAPLQGTELEAERRAAWS